MTHLTQELRLDFESIFLKLRLLDLFLDSEILVRHLPHLPQCRYGPASAFVLAFESEL